MSIRVDKSSWPVVQTVWDGEQTLGDVDAYIDDVLAIYARRELFVTVTWLKKYSTTPEVRRRISELMERSKDEVKKFSICSAMIAPSTGFRFVLSTILLVKKMDTPYQVCANFDEAMKFCRAEAIKRGLMLPSNIKAAINL